MQQLLLYLPIILFFAAYKLADIYVATIVLMITSTVMVIVERLATGQIKKMHLYGTALILVLGAITVAVRDPRFIQWKLTLVYWALGGVLAVNHLRQQKPLFQTLIEATVSDAADEENGASLELSPAQWRGVNLTWALFLFGIGALNLIVAYNFSEATWVNFKLFGVFALQFVALVATMWWMFTRNQPAKTDDRDQ